MNGRRKEGPDARIAELVNNYETNGTTAFLAEEAYHDLIEYYQSQEQFEKALNVARHACTQYRFTTDFYLRQAELLIYTNRAEVAQGIVEKALQFTPGDFELQLMLAMAYIRQDRHETGLVLLNTLKPGASREDVSDILMVESLIYERRTDYERMFYTLKAALKADPNNERALEGLGLCTEYCRKDKEAVELYRFLIDENAYNYLAWYYLGHSLYALDQKDEALEAYEYAYLTEPNFEYAYLDYAELCLEQRHFDRALDAYYEFRERFGTDAHLLLDIGTCYQFLQRHDTARSYFEEAARLDPANDEAVSKIGECYAAREQWKIAMGFYRKAIRLNPEDDLHHQCLAEAAFAVEDFTTAEAAYRSAIALSPEDPQLWLDLAWLFRETDRFPEAIDTLAEAEERTDDPEPRYAIAACLIAEGRRREGLAQLASVLAEHYAERSYLKDWLPHWEIDAEVRALLQSFRPLE